MSLKGLANYFGDGLSVLGSMPGFGRGNTYSGGYVYNPANYTQGVQNMMNRQAVLSGNTPDTRTISNTPMTQNNTGGVFGTLGGLFGLGLDAANAYTAYQQMGLNKKALQLAKDQYRFQSGLANRNLANQARIINTAYDNAAQVAAGMIGGKDAQGNYGFTSPEVIDRYSSYAQKQHVDGSPIKA